MTNNSEKLSARSLDRRIEHLLLSTQLDESGTNKFIIASILIICATILYLIVWASYTELDEITIANGTIVPNESIISLQHLEGGIISNVLFKNGDQVKKGQTVLKLSPEPATSDLERLMSQHNTMRINITRLEAFIDNKVLTYDDFISQLKYKNVSSKESIDALIENSIDYLKQQLINYFKEQEMVQTQIDKLSMNLDNYDHQTKILEERIDIAIEQNEIFKELQKENSIPKIALLNSEEELKEMHGTKLELERARTETANLLKESIQHLERLKLELKTKSLENLTVLSSDIIEIEKLIKKSSVRVARLTIKAGTFGIIKGLDLKPGSVIAPGQTLFELVPLQGGLVISAKVSTKDIGHVAVGDPVKVKIGSYDFSIYGSIPGKITKLSASTFIDPGEEPYYKASIELAKDYVGGNKNQNKILPGMTISAEIITNKKSVINYLLKPIKKSLGNALHER